MMKALIILIIIICLISLLVFQCAFGKKEIGDSQEPLPMTAKQTPAPRDPSRDLLLVVDFQNVYLPGYDWACPTMPEALNNTIRILNADTCPDCIMTKFVAPTNPTGRWKQYNEAYQEINENAFLAEFPDELKSYAQKAKVVEKSTFSSMNVEEVIAGMRGKNAVVLTGVVADCCILATMMAAIDMGYEVVYLYDCIAGTSTKSEAEIRSLAENHTPMQTTIMNSDEYLTAISGNR